MEAQYTDKELTCTDCSADFTFTAGEQEHHAKLGFTNDPKRCKPCRAERKRNSPDGGGGSGGGGYGGGEREMHEVICGDCGGVARVPFKPRGDKPVYCSDCFSNHRSG